jgi:undecaprenyl-diphosphatase
VGSLPTVAIAVALRSVKDQLVQMPVIAASCLLLTGTMLIVTDRLERKREAGDGTEEADTRSGQAIGIGIGQGIAILPGISRSGSCTIAGILLGLERGFAVKFAFLLMIPAVFGAACYEGLEAAQEGMDPALLSQSLVGAAVALFSGLAAIWITVKAVQRRGLWIFGIYCLLLGLFGLGLLWSRGTLLTGVS